MQISVDIDKVLITQKDPIESGEYNVTPCLFTFTDDYEDLIKTAVFSKDKTSYKMSIIHNQCQIPYEVLVNEGMTELGVYGYEENGNELVLRYSPKPCIFNVTKGSYKENAENSTPPTPTQYEQYEAKLQEGLDAIDEAIEQAERVDIDITKSGKIATVEITKSDGTVKSEEIYDGEGLDYDWQGTSLGVKKENDTEYEYVDLKGDCNFATFEINSNMELVMNKTEDMLLEFRINENSELEVLI